MLETAMKNKVEELNKVIDELNQNMSSLQNKLAEEESLKLVMLTIKYFCHFSLFFVLSLYTPLILDVNRMQLSLTREKRKQGKSWKSCKLL